MSVEKQRAEGVRWLRQAQDDLGAAEHLIRGQKFAQAAFYAQQSAEKALKALWRTLDQEAWGHSVTRLIRELPHDDFVQELNGLLDDARGLDKHYIPARYPDALPDLTPSESYTETEAKQAVAAAERIVQVVMRLLAE